MYSDSLIKKLKEAEKIVVLTGAGVSAESGVPTFRDPDGLWAQFRPEELASMDGFLKNPKRVWDWYSHRRKIINEIEPNPGHFALAAWEKRASEFHLITQNVDRLHHRAGSENVYELHGNIFTHRCVDCEKPFDLDSAPHGLQPQCKNCDGKIRPDVVWFGEMLPQKELSESFELSQNCDIFLSVGTSGEVYPAAQLPLMAAESGAYVVEINQNKTALSGAMTECLMGPSGVIIPKLLENVFDET